MKKLSETLCCVLVNLGVLDYFCVYSSILYADLISVGAYTRSHFLFVEQVTPRWQASSFKLDDDF